jgi:hypothetical protein
MVLSPQDRDILTRAVQTLQTSARGVPKKTLFRQIPDPTFPTSPIPVMVPYSVPAQDIWPLLLEATVYIQRHLDPDHTETVLTELMDVLVAVNRNLLTYPGTRLYHRKKEKELILESIGPYILGDKKLFIHGTETQTIVEHVVIPTTRLMERV